jgi:hypothetical protein
VTIQDRSNLAQAIESATERVKVFAQRVLGGSEAEAGPDHEDRSGRDTLPIRDYDELTVSQVKSRLQGLSTEELRAVRAYETRHKGRKTLVNLINRRLRAND